MNDPIISGERHEIKELQNEAEKVKKSNEAAEMIRKSEYIIRSKNRNIIWLANQQGKVFECFVSVWLPF